MKTFAIGKEGLSLSIIQEIIESKASIELSPEAKEKIKACRAFLDQKMAKSSEPIYGINTGFGYLQNVKVSDDRLIDLQHNLLLSHACGTGEFVPQEVVKLMLLLKIQSLAYGHSGVALETAELLVAFYNKNMTSMQVQG
jgi:histidine ammonia-lyase